VQINAQIDAQIDAPLRKPSGRKPRMSGREHGHDPALPHSVPAAGSQPHATDELEVVRFERENLQGWIRNSPPKPMSRRHRESR